MASMYNYCQYCVLYLSIHKLNNNNFVHYDHCLPYTIAYDTIHYWWTNDTIILC